jgi:hypothetical protein
VAQQYLIGTKELGESALARVGAKDSIDRYAELIDLVKTRCGPETAAIFAEPVRGLNRATGIATVTWFGAHEGTPLPFSQLDATALRSMADLLRQRLKSFATLFSDPTHGPTFASWLYVLSPSDILSIAGQPLIINWGMVPAAVATSEEGREANFRRTVEPYAPRIPLPPFTLDEAQSFPARLKQFELSEGSLAARGNLSAPQSRGRRQRNGCRRGA